MVVEDDEYSVICRSQGGDTKSFEILYRRYVAPIYSLSYKMTGSVELAEDLTQEVFIKAWEKLSTFKHQSTFFTWLYRLAVRLIIRKKSSAHLQNHSDVPIENLEEELVAKKGAYDKTDAWDVQNAITRLPARSRSAIILFDIEGYSHKEIAELMGIREGTSKSLIHRGRQQLKRELAL